MMRLLLTTVSYISALAPRIILDELGPRFAQLQRSIGEMQQELHPQKATADQSNP